MPTAAILDDIPKGAWIALMVLGFIVFWPIGLAILFYMFWSGKMHGWKNGRSQACGTSYRRHRSSGNTAFDSYRDETLKRLEEEQKEFHAFMERLRRAKDEQEFEQFMNERRANEGGAAAN